MRTWEFHDPRNLAVLVNRAIVRGNDWTAYVSHDADDGGWQFHGSNPHVSAEDMMVISLHEMYTLDPSISALVDLPLGWRAWREMKDGEWHRERC